MNRPWNFIGIRRGYPLTLWRIPFLARGAISFAGSGHWCILGLWYHWNDRSSFGYAKERVLHIWRLFCIAHEEQNDLKRSSRKPWEVTFAKLQWPIRGVR